MKKKTVFVDMDGVVADFEKTLYDMFPHILHLEGEERQNEIDDVCQTKARNIFSHLELMEDAKYAFSVLNEHYDVYFLSTPMWDVPESYMDKRIWLVQHFGENVHKKLILSHNKGLCIGDYLIDDRIKNGVETFAGEHIHFGQPGFMNWKEVLAYMAKKDNWVLN